MHIVIVGGGKIGEYLANQMLSHGHQLAIIESSLEVSRHLAEVLPRNAFIINGDGCDSSFQADADVAYADVFVATTGSDDENLVACEIARTVYKVPRAIALVNSPKNDRIFRACGIEGVSATSLIARVIEEEAFANDVKNPSFLRKHNMIMSELNLPYGNRAIPAKGRLLSEFELPETAVAVAVGSEDTLKAVDAQTMIYPGDSLVLISRQEDVKALKQLFRIPLED